MLLRFYTVLMDESSFHKMSMEKRGVLYTSMQLKIKTSLCNHNIFCRKKMRDKKVGTLEAKLDLEKCY